MKSTFSSVTIFMCNYCPKVKKVLNLHHLIIKSSFCVYLFGLETLAHKAGVFFLAENPLYHQQKKASEL